METAYNPRMIQNFSDATRPTDLVSETALMLNQIADAYPMLFGSKLNSYAKSEMQKAFTAFRKEFNLETIFRKYLRNNIGNDTATANDVREAAVSTLLHAALKQHHDFFTAKLDRKINDYSGMLETHSEQLSEYLITCSELLEKSHYTTPAIISLSHTKTRLHQQRTKAKYPMFGAYT